MAEDKKTVAGESQNVRRAKYGFNVFAMVVFALILVVILNWLGANYFKRLDWTATRRYSLSAQTHQLLAQLEGKCEIYTVFPRIDLKETPNRADEVAYMDQAKDLIDEYGRYGKQVSAEHFYSDDEARIEQLCGRIIQRYEQSLLPLQDAIDKGTALMTEIARASEKLSAGLQKTAGDANLGDGQLKEMLKQVAANLKQFTSAIETNGKQVKRAMDEPLPAYGSLAQQLKQLLEGVSQDLQSQSRIFADEANKNTTPDSVKENLLAMSESFKAVQEQIATVLGEMGEIAAVDEYDQLRNSLASEPTNIIIFGPRRMRVLTLSEMLSLPEDMKPQPGQRMELEFHGEEKLTGALVSVSLEQSPLVVFVAVEPTSPLTPNRQGTSYSVVAQRLKNMNFEVVEWYAVMRQQRGPMGQVQPIPPDPMPQAKEGQSVVWVVPPLPPMNPMNPMGGNVGNEVASKIRARLKEGDSVLVTVQPTGSASQGVPDPIEAVLLEMGVKFRPDQVVIREVMLPDNRKQIDPQVMLNQWPSASSITQALSGMPGVFVVPCPLTVDVKDGSGIDVKVLAQADGKQYWAEGNMQALETGGTVTRPGNAPEDPIALAVSAETEKARMVAVSNPMWAMDRITNLGMFGPGTAALTGAQFPANADLFVNSVYWLSGMDQFIAPGARSQDIRRVDAMEKGKLAAIQWTVLIAMPGAALAFGYVVWLFRRR